MEEDIYPLLFARPWVQLRLYARQPPRDGASWRGGRLVLAAAVALHMQMGRCVRERGQLSQHGSRHAVALILVGKLAPKWRTQAVSCIPVSKSMSIDLVLRRIINPSGVICCPAFSMRANVRSKAN